MKRSFKPSRRTILLISIYLILNTVFLYLCFAKLGSATVQNWDEARHGISAYEMLQTGNYIENTFNYEKDLWNLKPPLSFWAEALAFKVIGYNILAFRLPSVIAFIMMYIAITVFLIKNYGHCSAICFEISFIAFGDYFFSHFGRNGDADALFNLFFILCVICLYYFAYKKNTKYLYMSGLCASMSFMAKSFHAVSAYGVIVLFLLISGLFRKLKFRSWICLFISSTAIIASWIIWRYSYDGVIFIGSMFGVDVVERTASYQNTPDSNMVLWKVLINYRLLQV